MASFTSNSLDSEGGHPHPAELLIPQQGWRSGAVLKAIGTSGIIVISGYYARRSKSRACSNQ